MTGTANGARIGSTIATATATGWTGIATASTAANRAAITDARAPGVAAKTGIVKAANEADGRTGVARTMASSARDAKATTAADWTGIATNGARIRAAVAATGTVAAKIGTGASNLAARAVKVPGAGSVVDTAAVKAGITAVRDGMKV